MNPVNTLTVDSAVLVANAMISSRLDYCNSLLYGLSKDAVVKFRMFKMFCHTFFRLDKMSHVTSYLEKPHWLLVSYHFLFKDNLIFITFLKPKISPNPLFVIPDHV